jgi:hypothetical protein
MGDRSELQRWGFDVPQLELRLTSSQGEAERIIIGSAVPDQPDNFYAWNLRTPSFAIVSLSQLSELQLAPFSLRDRRVTALSSSELLRFRITDGNGREALLAKPQSTWRCAGAPLAAIPQPDVRLMARRFSTLVASQWIPDVLSAPDSDNYSLRADLLPVVGDEPLATIYFGDRGDDGLRLARLGSKGWVFRLALSDGPDLVRFCQRFLIELSEQETGAVDEGGGR